MKAYGELSVGIRRATEVAYDNEFGGMQKEEMTLREYVASQLDAPYVPFRGTQLCPAIPVFSVVKPMQYIPITTT